MPELKVGLSQHTASLARRLAGRSISVPAVPTVTSGYTTKPPSLPKPMLRRRGVGKLNTKDLVLELWQADSSKMGYPVEISWNIAKRRLRVYLSPFLVEHLALDGLLIGPQDLPHRKHAYDMPNEWSPPSSED